MNRYEIDVTMGRFMDNLNNKNLGVMALKVTINSSKSMVLYISSFFNFSYNFMASSVVRDKLYAFCIKFNLNKKYIKYMTLVNSSVLDFNKLINKYFNEKYLLINFKLKGYDF
jgi:hypothetical protein